MTEYEKIESNVWTWVQKGDEVEGKLVSREPGQFENQVYKIETKNGQITVFGTAILDSRLNEVEDGKMIKIVYQGEEPSKVKGHQPMKVFEVYVAKS